MSDKKQRQDDRDPFQMERQTNARAALRVLLALYLAYVIYKLIRGYFAGDLGMSMPLYFTALVIFVAAEIAILAFTVRRWRQGQKRIDRAWADREEEPEDLAGTAETMAPEEEEPEDTP